MAAESHTEMSTPEPPTEVEFLHEDDGRVTARHAETGVASFGETESEALRQLADALDAHFGRGESVDDPEQYLSGLGVEADVGDATGLPWSESGE